MSYRNLDCLDFANGKPMRLEIPSSMQDVKSATVCRWMKTCGQGVKGGEMVVELETETDFCSCRRLQTAWWRRRQRRLGRRAAWVSNGTTVEADRVLVAAGHTEGFVKVIRHRETDALGAGLYMMPRKVLRVVIGAGNLATDEHGLHSGHRGAETRRRHWRKKGSKEIEEIWKRGLSPLFDEVRWS
jgi:hypothetical protein